MRIYIDMDGVLCDFMGAYRKYKDTHEFPQSKIGIFKDLDPLPGAIESFKLLFYLYDVWILTRPSFRNLHCYTEKAEWVKNHLGQEALEKMIISGDKSLLKGDILIDDTNNANQDKFEGLWIRFGDNGSKDWPSVIRFVHDYYEFVHAKV
jgi:5'(3')-deoxyribonucleotidase